VPLKVTAKGPVRAERQASCAYQLVCPDGGNLLRGAEHEVLVVAELTELPALRHNRGLIADPVSFACDATAASWLHLCGEAFAAADGGMSYADVQKAVSRSMNIVSDPPVVMTMSLARQHIDALDQLPRPTLGHLPHWPSLISGDLPLRGAQSRSHRARRPRPSPSRQHAIRNPCDEMRSDGPIRRR
jgi:hypothetical protein